MTDKKIKEVLNNTTDKNCDKINWTRVWSDKYPVLETYQKEVDVPKYAAEIRKLLDQLKSEHGYSEVDAMLVLKDILAHEMKK